MKIIFIRHGPTPGNLARRYIGSTDEPLAPGVLPGCPAPAAERVYVSPLLRCRQTAALLYPASAPVTVPDLRECDFGAFEYKSYEQLQNDPAYRAWMEDRTGTLAPPGGEDTAAFRRRCGRAFEEIVERCLADGVSSAAFVVHGGTIMAVMERFAETDSPRGFYDWQPENFGGWTACTTRELWRDRRVLTGVRKLGEGAADA
ncbi:MULTISPECIES: histidine phosphatase family protein [Anaerotruncus]|uniref:Histidine phosphatase family protein n=1 Tax=Anaerotruncus massiliensis (ex Togo et al. 2019) TaxID=1673720 RepID=A0ABR7AAD7_9FIRM|nr:histidine phosphatase family protein [Anaerotruncus massiliensis (ex Liu et al. 2021)]MBC3937324.1 histidine phosphatase family protein [Anaerotruncus massiliensis (ex Togo et al. 2019)]